MTGDNVDSRVDLFLDIFRAACAQPRPRMNPELSIQLSENLHHYLDHTSKTLEALTEGAYRPLWTGLILQEAKTFPFVMNSLDALASLHRAHLSPSSSHDFVERALQSRSAAINDFREMVPQVTPQNASGTLTFSAIQVVLCLEFPVAMKESDASSIIDGVYELFVSIRGFFHLQPLTCPYITDPYLNAWMHTPRPDPPQSPINPTILSDVIHVYSLMDHFNNTPAERQSCLTALTQLYVFFSQAKLQSLDWNVMFAWPLLLSDDFLDLINTQHPFALVILAHWAVAVFQNTDHWLLFSWPRQMTRGVAGVLGPDGQFALARLSSLGSGNSAFDFNGPLPAEFANELSRMANLQLPHQCINPLIAEIMGIPSAD